MKRVAIVKTVIASLSLFTLFAPSAAEAQIVPRPWVSVGSQEGDVTFSVGARALGVGIELGRGPDNSTGVDVLKFLNLPFVAPYVGVGYYSEDEGFAYSAGVQLNASDNVFIGAGYNSVRGVNGQIGVKF